MFNYFISLFFVLFSLTLKAQTLRWAADTESGAPYVFYDAKTLKMTGFEYDLVKTLSEKMKMNPIFVQNSWDGLVLGLNNDLYDIAINGIEITEERKKNVFFSEPYYSTHLNLVVRSNDDGNKKLSDFSGRRVGTLTGALSEKILRSEDNIQVMTYESEALAHQDLLLGRTEALLLDAPIVKYYSEVDERFKILPTPIGAMTYGIAISKKNPELLKKINRALDELIESGELREIYERWALWNQPTALLFSDTTAPRLSPTEFENYKLNLNQNHDLSEKISIYKKVFPSFVKAAFLSLKVSLVSMIIAVLGGLILVGMKLYSPSIFKWSATLFIELIRGTPLLLQLFFVFYALPNLGVQISAFNAAVISLGINYSVQECEIYRAGLLQVHKNQIEAAKMLGLSGWQTFWNVQVPQAIKFCLPPMTTDFIALIKDSSLVSVITLVDLTKTYSTLSSTYYEYAGFALLTALFYLALGMPFVILSKRLEKETTLK